MRDHCTRNTPTLCSQAVPPTPRRPCPRDRRLSCCCCSKATRLRFPPNPILLIALRLSLTHLARILARSALGGGRLAQIRLLAPTKLAREQPTAARRPATGRVGCAPRSLARIALLCAIGSVRAAIQAGAGRAINRAREARLGQDIRRVAYGRAGGGGGGGGEAGADAAERYQRAVQELVQLYI